MKQIHIIFFLSNILLCCNEYETNSTYTENCFSEVDTLHTGESICCANTIFKKIGNRYILHIEPKLQIPFDKYYSISLIDINKSEKRFYSKDYYINS